MIIAEKIKTKNASLGIENSDPDISMIHNEIMPDTIIAIPSAIKKRLEIPMVPKKSKPSQSLKIRIYRSSRSGAIIIGNGSASMSAPKTPGLRRNQTSIPRKITADHPSRM